MNGPPWLVIPATHIRGDDNSPYAIELDDDTCRELARALLDTELAELKAEVRIRAISEGAYGHLNAVSLKLDGNLVDGSRWRLPDAG